MNDRLDTLLLERFSSQHDALPGRDLADIHARMSRATEPQNSAAPRPERKRFRRLRERPLLLVLVVFGIALVPVSALAVVKNDPWWFLRFANMVGEAPAKGSHVVVLETGTWDRQRWVFTAYRSVRGSLCTEFTELASNGQPTSQGAGGCGPVPGAMVRLFNGRRRLTIRYGGGSLGQIHYVVGPVVSTASEVRITLVDGTVLTTPTFAAPNALGLPIRFYATQLPSPAASSATTCRQRVTEDNATRPRQLVGLDSSGTIVATLTAPPRPPGFLQTLCQPHRNQFILPPDLPASARALKTVEHLTAPYGARAALAVGGVFPMPGGRFLPSGHLKRFTQESRCWRISFSNGQSQGTCTPIARINEPELSPQVQHAGRDTFVIVYAAPRLGAPIARVDLLLANGKTLSKKPVDSMVIFPIPKDALSTTHSQRGFLTAYDKAGNLLTQDNSFANVRFTRQPVYYRSCPPGTSCYG